MATTPIELLKRRLLDLGEIFRGTGMTADEARTAILSLQCAEAIAGRLQAGGKLHKFRSLFEESFGVPLDTRERVARAKRRAG